MSARGQYFRRGSTGLLVKTIAQLVGDPGAVAPLYPMLMLESGTTRPWSSATFDGEHHRLELRLHGTAAAIGDALDRLVDGLPDAEFELPGQIVAEARLVAVGVDPDPAVAALSLVVEVITVVD